MEHLLYIKIAKLKSPEFGYFAMLTENSNLSIMISKHTF